MWEYLENRQRCNFGDQMEETLEQYGRRRASLKRPDGSGSRIKNTNGLIFDPFELWIGVSLLS